MNLQFVRKGPRLARRIAIGADLRARGIARQLSEQKAIEQARIVHERWLASRATAGVPDLTYLEAARVAEQAHIEELRLLAELHAELEAERQPCETAEARPRAYVPARRPRMGHSPAPPDSHWR